MKKEYEIIIAPASIEEVGKHWIDLESRSNANIFLSWVWNRTWLEVIQPAFELVIIRSCDAVVGLGLLTRVLERRHGLIFSRVYRLGRTGNQRDDQIWPEYGGLLIAKGYEQSAPQALMTYLHERNDWDELELGAMTVDQIASYYGNGCVVVEKWDSPTYGVSLSVLDKDYLSSLSRNTRYQINRCRKLYAELGDLSFEILTSVAEIREVWPWIAESHRKRWGDTAEGSGFSNDRFVGFHLRLMKYGCEDGHVEVCVLKSGSRILGCLYNFIYSNRIYFYLSALVNEENPHLKPGLLLHALAIEHYRNVGYEYYDFMGGDSQYKRSLGEKHSDLKILSLQRKRIKLGVERKARYIKHLWEKWRDR